MANKFIILQTQNTDGSAQILADENFAKLLDTYAADVVCVDQHLEDTRQLKALLAAWQMPEFVFEQCQKFGIGVSHLKKIENEEINVLIPDKYLGVRVDFKFALREWRENQITPADINTNAGSSRVLKWIQQNFEKDAAIASSGASLISEAVAAAVEDSSGSGSSGEADPPKKLDLKQILKTNALGVNLLKDCDQKLLPRQQLTLIQMICLHFMNQNMTLSVAEISNLADQIVEIFPRESKKTYFVPRNGKTLATGKLLNKYKNMRKTKNIGGILKQNIRQTNDGKKQPEMQVPQRTSKRLSDISDAACETDEDNTGRLSPAKSIKIEEEFQ